MRLILQFQESVIITNSVWRIEYLIRIEGPDLREDIP